MSLRTPYSRVTGLGSAREGAAEFFNQRLTALANIPLTLFLIWLVISLMGAPRDEVMAAFANPIISGLTILTIVSVAVHMQIGVKIVIEDYVHHEGLKILAMIGNRFFSFAVAAIAISSVLLLGFGG